MICSLGKTKLGANKLMPSPTNKLDHVIQTDWGRCESVIIRDTENWNNRMIL